MERRAEGKVTRGDEEEELMGNLALGGGKTMSWTRVETTRRKKAHPKEDRKGRLRSESDDVSQDFGSQGTDSFHHEVIDASSGEDPAGKVSAKIR